MARPRKNDPTKIILPILQEFANQLSSAVERFTIEQIKGMIGGHNFGNSLRGRTGRKRAKVLCYYPGCTNVAAPRFGMFCAALHKNISKAQKSKFRARHEKRAAA